MNRLFQSSVILADRLRAGERPSRFQFWLAFTLMNVNGLPSSLLSDDAGGRFDHLLAGEGGGGSFLASAALFLLFALTLGALVNLLFIGGLWFHLGIKALSGGASFRETLEATAAGYLGPATAGFLAALGSTLLSHLGPPEWAPAVLTFGVVYAVGVGWAFLRALNTARHVHEVGVGAAVAVAFWIPAAIGVGGAILGLVPGIGS